MQITVTMLRRGPNAPHITIDPTCVVGRVYSEYSEIWFKQSAAEWLAEKLAVDPNWTGKVPDDLERKPTLVSRDPTGKRYVFVERVTPEQYDEDPAVKARADQYVVVLKHDDFTMCLMREIFQCSAITGPTMQCCTQDAGFWVGSNATDAYSYACGDHVEDVRGDDDRVVRLTDGQEILG